MCFFKKLFALAVIASFAGCGDDSSDKGVAATDTDDHISANDSSSSGKNGAKSSSSISKDARSSSSGKNIGSSSSSENGSSSNDYEHGYIGFMDDRTVDLIANEPVRIWAPTADGLKLISTDTLDSEGKLALNASLSGFHLVEIRYDGLAAMRWLNFSDNMESGIYATKPAAMVTGVIKNRGVGIEGAKLSILDVESQTNANGEFEIDGLPDGVHFMTVEYSGEFRIYQVQVSRTVGFREEQIMNQIEWDNGVYTLLTDFEDWQSGRTVVGNMFDFVGPYYFFTDSLNGGGSRWIGKGEFANADKFRNDDVMGTCMYLHANIDEETEDHFAGAGFLLGEDERDVKDNNYAFFDISGATGLSFDAKGSGSLFLQIVSRKADGSSDYISPNSIELTEEWNTYTYSFEKVSSRLTAASAINFMFKEDAEIYIDNVRLDGLVATTWPSLGKKF